MIEPTNVDQLDVARAIHVKCKNCGHDKVYNHSGISMSDTGEIEDLKCDTCPECGHPLRDEEVREIQAHNIGKKVNAIRCQECKKCGYDKLQKRDGGLFKCTKYPTRHVTKVGPEHH